MDEKNMESALEQALDERSEGGGDGGSGGVAPATGIEATRTESLESLLKPRKKLGPKLSIPDLADIIGRLKGLRASGIAIGEACEVVAQEMGREPSAIYAAWKRLSPTVDIAEVYLRSQAFKLATRVVREANVDQAIDILSRKNVGVLAPKTEEGSGQGGFFLSVQADSCGAVKIAGGHVPQLPVANEFEMYKETTPAPAPVPLQIEASAVIEATLVAAPAPVVVEPPVKKVRPTPPPKPIIDLYTEEKGVSPTRISRKGQGSLLVNPEPTKRQQEALDAARKKRKRADRDARRLRKQWKALGGL